MIRRKKQPTGQSLVEFALTLPMLILAITFFLDFGRAIYYYGALNNAIREGTRYSVVHPVQSACEINDVVNLVRDRAIGLDLSALNVEVVPATSSDPHVTITATYVFRPVTPGLSQILGAGKQITLRSRSVVSVAPVNMP